MSKPGGRRRSRNAPTDAQLSYLRELRSGAGLETDAELADAMSAIGAPNASRRAVSAWFGQANGITQENQNFFARAVGLDPDKFVAEYARRAFRIEPKSGSSNVVVSPNQPIPFPSRGRFAAETETSGYVEDQPMLDPDDFAGRRRESLGSAEVVGSCMEPELYPGWRVFFDADQTPVNGDTVVARLRETGHDKWVIKRFYEVGGQVHLVGNDGSKVVCSWPTIAKMAVVFQVNSPPPPRRSYPISEGRAS